MQTTTVLHVYCKSSLYLVYCRVWFAASFCMSLCALFYILSCGPSSPPDLFTVIDLGERSLHNRVLRSAHNRPASAILYALLCEPKRVALQPVFTSTHLPLSLSLSFSLSLSHTILRSLSLSLFRFLSLPLSLLYCILYMNVL
jgi:hypothetical protein